LLAIAITFMRYFDKTTHKHKLIQIAKMLTTYNSVPLRTEVKAKKISKRFEKEFVSSHIIDIKRSKKLFSASEWGRLLRERESVLHTMMVVAR
jgi:hypothetical protein